jgi:uncharacterized protein (TIGR02147 family)
VAELAIAGAELDPAAELRREFEKRRRRNRAYSHAAFARRLGISPSYLSLLLAGKRILSEERAEKLSRALRWPSDRAQRFVLAARIRSCRDPERRARLLTEYRRSRDAAAFAPLRGDLIALISSWYMSAVLALLELPGRFTTEEVRRRLKLDQVAAEVALARLVHVGLARRDGDQHWRIPANLSTGDVPSSAIRRHHREYLEKAIEAIENQPPQQRNISGSTFPCDASKIPEAMQRIEVFRRELMTFLQEGTPDSVYRLSVQLFRLDVGA